MKSSLRRLYGRHHDLVYRYGMSVLQITMDMFRLSYHNHNPFLLIFINNHRIFNKSNTTGTTSGAGTAYLFRIFVWGSCCSMVSFLCNVLFFYRLCILLSVLLYTASDYSIGIFTFFLRKPKNLTILSRLSWKQYIRITIGFPCFFNLIKTPKPFLISQIYLYT